MMGSNSKINTAGLSTEKILLCVLKEASICFFGSKNVIRFLDLGAGNGELIKLISSTLNTNPSACDYTESLMELDGQSIDVCDLNTQNFPTTITHSILLLSLRLLNTFKITG
mgnify:CR=1 FL=1